MKRQRSTGRTTNVANGSESKSDEISPTIRALMGSDATIFSLFGFVKEFSPNLPIVEPTEHTQDLIRLRNTLVCPMYPLKPSKSRNVSCAESLSSLVDDVIWSLVQRRSKDKQRNVLSQGYVLASEQLSQTHDIRPCREMRPGVLCTHMNDNVSFCKTSSYAKTLHRIFGDDVVRTLLLHTYVFLPVEQDWTRPKQNYLLLCGPPMQGGPMSLDLPSSTNEKAARREKNVRHDGQQGRRKRQKRKRKENEAPQPSTSTDRSLQANAIIPRSSLFYSGAFVPKVGLPSTHILNQQPRNCQSLLLSLLGTNKKGRKRLTRVRELGIPLCEEIFRRNSKCDYHRLLNRYCPLPDFCRQADTSEHGKEITLPQLSAAYSSADGVVSFLRAVLRQVFPTEFWGSEHNFQRVLDATETFVHLRRQEQLPMKTLMNGICIKDVLWIYGGDDALSMDSKASGRKKSFPKSLHEAATARMANVMKWLFVHYIIPLLRSIFYITESEFSAKRVLYYRKPVWSIFRSLSMKKLLSRQYKEISSNEALSCISEQKMGFSKLRLLPKATGVRALALLSKREFVDIETRSNGTTDKASDSTQDSSPSPPTKKPRLCGARPPQRDKKFSSTNAVLRNVFEVLRYERERHPDSFGSGVFGLNEVYPEYMRFLESFRGLKTYMNGSELKKFFFASVDIKQCYDSIEQKHLLDILPKLLDEREYLIQNSAVVHPFKSMGRSLRKPVKRVGAPEGYRSFHDVVEELVRDYNRSIFVAGGSSLVRREDILKLLQDHLLHHIVVIQGRYGNRFLLQNLGIPQGSILSTLLCNLYYGDVEFSLLGSVIETRASNSSSVRVSRNVDGHVTLLVRIVDDFLLITTNETLSSKFLAIMNEGCDDLGVRINKEKTLVNYDAHVEGSNGVIEELPRSDVDTVEKKRNVFPWCGMLFDTENGELTVDYSRFANGKASDALTVDRTGGEGQQLAIRMKTFVRPRCQPMLFDSRINSVRTVAFNFCQAILLCAAKTLAYIQGLEGGAQRNADFVVRNIDDVILYAHKLVADRLRCGRTDVVQPASARDNLFHLARQEAMWLGRRAFLSLFRGANESTEIVSLLASKCGAPLYRHPLQDVADEAILDFNAIVIASPAIR